MAYFINNYRHTLQSRVGKYYHKWIIRKEWVVFGVLVSLVANGYTQKITKKSSEFTFLHAQQAKFATDLSSFEVTIPHKSTVTGEFVSHAVHHTLQGSRLHRRKRNTEHVFNSEFQKHINSNKLSNSDKLQVVLNKAKEYSEINENKQLHYVLNVNNQDLLLELEPNNKLIAPGLVIEKRPQGYKNLSHAIITEYPENRCHYFGKVKGDPGSKVALATCHGLHGFIHTSHGQYLIEPVKGYNYTQGEKHPHLIYNRIDLPPHLDIVRSTKHQNSNGNSNMHHSSCGVEGLYKDTEKARESWQEENKKSQDTNSVKDQENSRKKRSISRERYVEVMVVVDNEMMNFFKDEDVQTYVLTIMNMVSVLYHDSSIGNAVNVVLVNLMLMDYDEAKLQITHHADNTLRSFCKWQKSINIKDDNDPNHHDVAVLLTRRNICSKRNEPCSTLGLSQVNGLCQPHRSCNINEDTGLSLAFTVAHELGHNFGMQHDGPQSGCEAEEGKYQLIMAAQLNAEASPMVWSPCSRDAVTKFLDRDWGYCLDDEPSEHDYYIDERPPGIKYDADHQCRLQYGEEAQYCQGIDNLCTTLWCKVQNKCMTRLEAAAEGTICGDNKWCSGGRCIMQGETPLAQNGEWGQWGDWSDCSRSCGAGVAYRQRHCDNPGPHNGGNYCLGERKRYRICNTEHCPEHMPNFKDIQCSNYNEIPYKGKYYQWQYVVNPRTPCQLHCRPKGHFFSVMLSDMVNDGTSCPVKGIRAMCISGLCREVGCDWEIDSEAKEDGCGVCRGDGSTCKTIKTKFNKEQGMGYVEALVIPEGARNIRIEEVAEANNYLAIRNDDGQYYLNGGWFIQWNGDYEAAGTVITYERVGDKEMLKAPGPLKEDLHVMLLFQSENPGVEFEYTIPNANATDLRTPEFKWIYLDWTHCTHSCGGGTQRSQVVCSETELGIVDDMHCNASTRPEDMLSVCNDHICPPRWWPGPWQHCSVSCGDDGVRRRTVLCVRSSGHQVQEALEDWECDDMEKPVEKEICLHKPPCATHGLWQIGPWSDCTRTCNGGFQLRSVFCVEGQACQLDEKPISERKCSTQPCHSGSGISNSQYTTIHDINDSFNNKANIINATQTFSLPKTVVTVATNKARNERLKDLKPKMKDEFKKKNIIYTLDDFNPKDTTTTTAVYITTLADLVTTKIQTVKEIIPTTIQKITSYLKQMGKQSKAVNDDWLGLFSTTMSPRDNYMWVALFWGECSTNCGAGTKTRAVKCFNKITYEEDKDSYCLGMSKPVNTRGCDNSPCLQWTVGEWGQCSETCNNGTQWRTITCPEEDKCDPNERPEDSKPCYIRKCVDWVTGDWGQCSKTCNSGHQTRKVDCMDLSTQTSSNECPVKYRPSYLKRCNMEPCSSDNEVQRRRISYICFSDILSQHVCTALKRMGRCWHNVVQYKCCRTCQAIKRRVLTRKKLNQKENLT